MRIFLNILLVLCLFFSTPLRAEEAGTPPDLLCDYIYMVDRNNGQVLMDEKSMERIYPASLTKLMTAIVALEHIDNLNATYRFDDLTLQGLKEANAAMAGFKVGDEPTLKDLLYGDLLSSGADCSGALARYVAGSEPAFVAMMNEKAKELGMTGTNFINTSGLHDDRHYSTCRDLMTLFLYCLENETFTDMMKTMTYVSSPVKSAPEGITMRNLVLIYVNQDPPIYENYDIEGFVGGKSGFTNEAQYTLASEAVFNGMDLVLINCHGYVSPHYPASIEDASNIYHYYKENYSRRALFQQGQIVGSLRVRNTWDFDLKVAIDGNVDMDLAQGEGLKIEMDIPETMNAPVLKGMKVGEMRVYSFGKLMRTRNLYAVEEKPWSYWAIWKTFAYEKRLILAIALSVIILCLLVKLMHMRKKR